MSRPVGLDLYNQIMQFIIENNNTQHPMTYRLRHKNSNILLKVKTKVVIPQKGGILNLQQYSSYGNEVS